MECINRYAVKFVLLTEGKNVLNFLCELNFNIVIFGVKWKLYVCYIFEVVIVKVSIMNKAMNSVNGCYYTDKNQKKKNRSRCASVLSEGHLSVAITG